MEIPTGIFADTFGRKKAILISMATITLTLSLFTIWHSFTWFAIGMLLLGVAEAFRSGTHNALMIAYLHMNGMEDITTEYYGSIRSWWQIGSGTSALLAGILLALTENYNVIFLVSALFMAINFVNVYTYPSEIDLKGTRKRHIREVWQSFTWLFKHKYTLRVLLNSSISTGVFRGSKDYLQAILKTMALSIPAGLWLSSRQRKAIFIGIAYFVIYLLNTIAARHAHQISLPSHTAINILYMLSALLLILSGMMVFMEHYIMATLLFICIYMVLNTARPFIIDYISGVVETEDMAMALSTETQLTTITSGIVAPIAGKVADAYGIGSALFIAGIIALIGIPFTAVKPYSPYNVSTGGERYG